MRIATAITCTLMVGLGACNASKEIPDDDRVEPDDFEVTIELSDYISTVANFSFTTEVGELESAFVQFGGSTDYSTTVPVDMTKGSPYQVWLAGMKPNSTYHARVSANSGGTTHVSNDYSVTTGHRPNELPDIEVDLRHEEQSLMAQGGYLITSIFGAPATPIILDGDGEYVWWHSAPKDFPVSRTRLSADGQWVYYWTTNVHGAGLRPNDDDPPDNQALYRVSIDGSVEESFDLSEGHHDFFEMSDGHIAFIEYDKRHVDGEEVWGDRIMDLDPQTGNTTEIYSIWDDFEYDPDAQPEDDHSENWSHGNALRFDAEEDSLYLGFRVFSSIIKVDRNGGTLEWVLGGEGNDFDGGDKIFNSQHGFQIVEDGLVVFDNGDPKRNYSQVIHLSLNEDTLTAEPNWTYKPEPSTYTFSLGDVLCLPNGNYLADFSNGGQMDEFTADGDLVWRLNGDLGGAFGYVFYVEDLYAAQ
ncbi:MAG: hypothetical protein HN348_05870 [Proteobacteria bacterium]|nr:hypothetical protein [Pseudomonadota bacterium]